MIMTGNIDQAWHNLENIAEEHKGLSLKELFDSDPHRFDKFSMNLDGLIFDYSKNNLGEDCVDALIALAAAAGVEGRRSAMASGEHINVTEDRAVLHMALRSQLKSAVSSEVENNREAMLAYAEKIRSGAICGATGKVFTDVVNIGIGGSDLGPAMVTLALSPFHDGPNCHFISNADGAHIADTLKPLNAETTLFIVASKTFTTLETMTNAASALSWLSHVIDNEAARAHHFVAVSAAPDKAIEFGIPADHIFGFQAWVGGRYSVWSSVGLPVAIAIGAENFNEFLAGARAVDAHFIEMPLNNNVPVMMALIGIWNRNVMGYSAQAILPYDQRLSRFSAYLQQLDMESNGKRVGLDGEIVSKETGPLIWGEPGTNGQHAFYQWLHQGTDIVPADFLIAKKPLSADPLHHNILLANCFAQSETLAVGRDLEATKNSLRTRGFSEGDVARLALYQTFPGNRPSNTILYEQLTPKVMGMLIALYEHKVFVQGTIWQINSFDQFGVELGKEMATMLASSVKGDSDCQSISKGLINRLRD